MNIDDFVNKAVSQVRLAKTTGKKANQARKELKASEALLAQTKQTIRDVAVACEKRAWRETKLVMMRFERHCKSCGQTSSCIDAVYLEKTHKKCGMIRTRLDEVQVSSYPSLPRTIEYHEKESCLCAACFLSYSHNQIDLPFETSPSPLKAKIPSKWDMEYANFSLDFDKKFQAKLMSKWMPTFPLLEQLA